MQIRYDAEHSAQGRIGLGFEADAGTFAGQPLALTGILNLRQRYGDPSLAFVSGQPLSLEQSSGSPEAGLGLSLGRSDSPFAFFSEGSYEAAIRGYGESGWTASAGVRMAF
jgi:outer membrane autotransporter protein